VKKARNEPVNQDRWLGSFAILMTLLFALFVILYATSKADFEKLKKVKAGMQGAFEGEPESPSQVEKQNPQPQSKTSQESNENSAKESAAVKLEKARDSIRESFAREAGVPDLADKVQVAEDDRGLIVRLAAKDFFDDGVVEARADLRPLLDRIAKVLATIPNGVRVEGHTDIEEEAGNSVQGWKLSTERASWVVQYWIKRFDLEPARLSAAGLSHFHPLTLRKDDYSRGKNRRVEIIILKK
jgi:chemotaxis protein MotB